MSDTDILDLGDADAFFRAAPVRKLIWMVLLLGIKDRATEVRFEPQLGSFKISCRVNGVLYELVPPPSHLARAIINVLKVLGNLDIVRKDRVQRGFLKAKLAEDLVDMIVSVQPTKFGESVLIDVFAPEDTHAKAAKVLHAYTFPEEGSEDSCFP